VADSKTFKEISNDPKIEEALLAYEIDRGKTISNTTEESLKNFLDDYRSIQVNTVGGISFANYVSDIEDEEYKDKLGYLYNTVDQEMESQINPFDEDVGALEAARGIGKYIQYAVLDPVNILGLGVGKVATSIASRPVINGAIKSAFAGRFKRMAIGATAGAIPEAGIGAAQEYQVQRAEQELDLREEKSAAEIGTAAAVGGLFGAFFGGISGISDPYKVSRKIIDELNNTDTPQGRAATSNNLGEAKKVSKEAEMPSNIEGLYVTITPKAKPKDLKGFDDMGRVIKSEGDIITVEFLSLKPEAKIDVESRKRFEFKDTDATAVSPLGVKQRASNYIKKTGKFFDRQQIEKGAKFLEENKAAFNLNPGDMDPVYTILQDAEIMKMFDRVTQDIVMSTRSTLNLGKFIDVRSNNTEMVASVLDELPIEQLDATLREILTKNGVVKKDPKTGKVLLDANGNQIPDLELYSQAYRATISQEAIALAGRKEIDLEKLNSFEDYILQDTTKTKLSEKDLNTIALAKEERIRAEQAKSQGFWSSFIDLWRSFLVMQPVTTARNIAGSSLQVPGLTFRAKLDNLFAAAERREQGLPPLSEDDLILDNPNATELLGRLLRPQDSVELMKIYAESNSRVKDLLLNMFDDRLLLVPDEGANKLIRGGLRASKWLNTLNTMQDRAIKSAAFLSELNRELIKGINKGEITGVRGKVTKTGKKTAVVDRTMDGKTTEIEIKSIEDVIQYNRFDLISDSMIEKALKEAYAITYQSRNAGDKLLIFGDSVNKMQRWASDTALIKLGIPFPNFVINSMVYTLNRITPLGIMKYATRQGQLMRRQNDVVNNRKRLDELSQKGVLSSEEKIELREKRAFFGKQEKLRGDLKDGLVETADSAMFLGVAVALRYTIGGENWNEYVSPFTGEKYNITPLFPLAPFALLADLLVRSIRNEPWPTDYASQIATVVTSMEGRTGALGDLLTNLNGILRTFADKDEDVPGEVLDNAGRAVGALVGGIFGGFAMFTRPLEDVRVTLSGDTADRTYLDLKQQRDYLLKAGIFDRSDIQTDGLNTFTSGMLDEMVNSIVRGTPFERLVFDETKKSYSPLQTGPKKRGSLTAVKQYLGAANLGEQGDVAKKFDELGIEKWKVSKYSEVPEWNRQYNRTLGALSDEIVAPFIKSPEFLNMPPNEQRKVLYNLYFNRGSDATSPAIKNLMKMPQGRYHNNLRSYAAEVIRKNYPVLDQFKTLKRKMSSSDEEEVLKMIRVEYPPEEVKNIYNNYFYESEKNSSELKKSMEIIERYFAKLKRERDKKSPMLQRSIRYGSALN
jgi:hypothetical protein